MSRAPAFAFYGHHKCATMWLNTIAAAVCRRLGLEFQAVYNEHAFDRDLPRFIDKHRVDFLAYGNADIDYVKTLPSPRAFHIIRDPRDIVVSAYFSHLYSHSTKMWPELTEHRNRLRELPKNEGLACELKFRQREFNHLRNWNYEQSTVLEIRYEDITAASYKSLLTIFNFLGLLDDTDYKWPVRVKMVFVEFIARLAATGGTKVPGLLALNRLPAAELLTIAWRNRFEAMTGGRDRGEQAPDNHYRKGQSGDWENHFTPYHKNLFKDLYPGLVPQLGYAESDDW